MVGSSASALHVIEEREQQLLRWMRYSSDSLAPLSSAEIAGPGEEYTVEHFFILADTMYLLYSGWNGEQERTEVFISKYLPDGKAAGEAVLIHSRSESGRPRSSGLQCVMSPDSLKMLLFFDGEQERKQAEGIAFKCVNRRMDVLWEKDLRLPPAPEIAQVHHFLLDNHAGLYMMSGRKPIKSFSEWQRPQGGQYVVYYYDPFAKRLKQYDISLKDKQILTVEFDLNHKQEVVIAGYYSNNFKFRVAGTLLFTIHAFGGSMKKAAFTPFSEEFMELMTASGHETPEDFYLDYLHLDSSGRAILVGEQYYVSRFVSTDPTTGRQMVEYRYNFDDIMVHCLDTAAQHVWNVRVPKRQFTNSPTDRHFSYAFAPSAERYTITFNDDNSSTERLLSGEDTQAALWNGSKQSVTTQCEITAAGAMTRYTLCDNGSERLLFSPLMVTAGALGQSVFGFDDNRSYKFCRKR